MGLDLKTLLEVMSQVALPSHRQSGVQKYLPQKMEISTRDFGGT